MKQILRYPLKNIGEYDDYLKIDVVKYNAPGLFTSSKTFSLRTTEQALAENIKNSDTSIILPMPQQISDSNTASWGESEMNPLTASVVSAANAVVSSGTPFETGLSELKEIGKKIAGAAKDGATQRAIEAYFSGEVAKALLGQDNGNLLSRATGVVMNQNVELLFSGVELRQAFQFSYDLIPRSKDESELVKKIIRIFKKEMTAGKGSSSNTGGGLFVRSPNVFNLSYMSGSKKHPFLHSFKPCALLGMSVDYTASGTYATYSDATPVHLKLTLQFRELSIIYSEDYTENDIGVGY